MDCPRCGSPPASERTACYEAIKVEGARTRTREIVERLWELVETNGKVGQHQKEIAFRDFARELEHEYLANTEEPSS